MMYCLGQMFFIIYMKTTLFTNTIIVTVHRVTESNMCERFIPVTHLVFELHELTLKNKNIKNGIKQQCRVLLLLGMRMRIFCLAPVKQLNHAHRRDSNPCAAFYNPVVLYPCRSSQTAALLCPSTCVCICISISLVPRPHPLLKKRVW